MRLINYIILNYNSIYSNSLKNNIENVLITQKIVGGNEVYPKFKYSFMVSIQYNNGKNMCGGA